MKQATETPEVLEKLEDKLNETETDPTGPEAWNPDQAGETLLGKVVDFDQDAPGYSGPCDVATVRTKAGKKKALWLSNTVLKRLWNEKEPTPGDYIGVKYQGKNESNNGREYKVFSLEVERANKQEPAERKKKVTPKK